MPDFNGMAIHFLAANAIIISVLSGGSSAGAVFCTKKEAFFAWNEILLAQLNHELSAGDKSLHTASLNLEIAFGPGLPPGLR